jgi:outer membrane biosynthesis protein TonB
MPGALGPRFVLEAGFLILLAVVVGFADLSPALIVLVMAIGWILVSCIEYFAWRQLQAAAAAGHDVPMGAPAPAVEEERVEEVAPPPPPPPPPAPADDETIVAPPAQEPEPPRPPVQAETEPAAAGAAAAEETVTFRPEEPRNVSHRLEPLRPRPRRRWIFFGSYERAPEAQAEGDREEES